MFVPKVLPEHAPIESARQNTELHDIYESVKDNRIAVAQLKTQMDTYMNIIGPDRDGLETRITNLTDQLSSKFAGATYISLYDSSRILYPTQVSDLERATYEMDYGRATLGIIKSDRMFIMTDAITGAKSLANDINALVTRSSITNKGAGAKLEQIIENAIGNAFDPDPTKMYFAKFITYDPGLTSVDLQVVAQTRGLIDQTINTVRINPMPEGTMDLTSLRYENRTAESKYFQHAGYAVEYGSAVSQMRKTAWSVDPTLVNKITVSVRQSYRQGSQPYVFPLGLKQVVFENNVYTNRSYIGFKVTVPTSKLGFMALESNLDNYGSVVNLKVYTNIDDFNNMNNNFIYQSGDVIAYNQPALVPEGSVVYILAELNKFSNTDATPELERVVITWR